MNFTSPWPSYYPGDVGFWNGGYLSVTSDGIHGNSNPPLQPHYCQLFRQANTLTFAFYYIKYCYIIIYLHIITSLGSCSPWDIIHSDQWSSYSQVAGLSNVAGHNTVNHSVTFVDPTTGTHTQNVESYWNRVKVRNY